MKYLALIPFLALAACQKPAAITCPQVAQHDKAYWQGLANEFESSVKGKLPYTSQQLLDYQSLKRQVLYCLSRKKGR